MNTRRAVFFDRDGTLIVERNYLKDPDKVDLFPGAGQALKRLQDHGFLLFIVTNQSGIGRGYYTVQDMEAVNERLLALLARDGVQIHHVYFAPEAPDQPSRGRKPSPQFLFEARDQFDLDLSRSYLVGDKLIDLECGWNAGVRMPLLVRTGYGSETAEKLAPGAKCLTCDHLQQAAEWILADGLAQDPLPPPERGHSCPQQR
jgi:D-glycero-D-manno-heptose 1,7-bisphosphate phosphatase